MSKLLKELNRLSEMTQVAGVLDDRLKLNFNQYLAEVKKNPKSFKHDGDLDFGDHDQVYLRKKLNVNQSIYLIKRGEKFEAYFAVQFDGHRPLLCEAYVTAEMRGSKIFTRFVWYLKNSLKVSAVELSKVHSQDTINMLKALFKSKRFKMHWENSDTGEKKPYDPATLDDFYGMQHATDWSVVLENTHDFNISRFMPGHGNLLEGSYDWLIEDMTPYLTDEGKLK